MHLEALETVMRLVPLLTLMLLRLDKKTLELAININPFQDVDNRGEEIKFQKCKDYFLIQIS